MPTECVFSNKQSINARFIHSLFKERCIDSANTRNASRFPSVSSCSHRLDSSNVDLSWSDYPIIPFSLPTCEKYRFALSKSSRKYAHTPILNHVT